MDKEKIGYAWNVVADLGNSRQFSISGNFSTTATKEDIDKEVDKVISVVNRQQAKAASIGVEQEISQLELRLDSASEDLADLDLKYGAKGGLSAAERQQREAAVKHLEKMGKDISFKKEYLSKLKEEAK